MSQSNRINHQPIFLLSTKPWRENSLWVEAFSRDYGRVALLARSARTRGSELRGVLIPFVPLSASWYGKEELKTLHRAEWLGGWAQPHSRALFSAMYVNELLMKLTAREDPHDDIYAALYRGMQTICAQENHVAALRQFEYALLNTLGVAPDFSLDSNNQLIESEKYYWIRAEEAVCHVGESFRQPETGTVAQGVVLQQIQQGQFSQPKYAQTAAKVMRELIDFRLPEMHTRLILQQLNQLKSRAETFTKPS